MIKLAAKYLEANLIYVFIDLNNGHNEHMENLSIERETNMT